MTRIAQTTFHRTNLALLAAVLVAGGAVLRIDPFVIAPAQPSTEPTA